MPRGIFQDPLLRRQHIHIQNGNVAGIFFPRGVYSRTVKDIQLTFPVKYVTYLFPHADLLLPGYTVPNAPAYHLTGEFMNRNDSLTILLFFLLAAGTLIIAPCMAATTQLHVVKYANDRTTVINETTVTYQWMESHLPVLGDGVTRYYHQGPVFADDPASATHEEELRWNVTENTNVQEKDYGAVKGTNLKDICTLVGGLSPGEEVTLKAVDGLTKNFAYKNVYEYTPRQGPMVITWSKDGSTPEAGYDEAMKLVFFADTSSNPWGLHAFGNWDWHESADSQYWYYYTQGTKRYPTTTGLSVKYISDVIINSNSPPPLIPLPVANFSASPQSGIAPLTVQFNDLSTGTPTTWSWDFSNDGTIESTQKNPAYTFQSSGTYTVKLTVSNTRGSSSREGQISVTPSSAVKLVAMFDADTYSGTAPLTIRFSDRSTGNPDRYAWDFNNDSVIESTLMYPSFTYEHAGDFIVNLTVTNAVGTDHTTMRIRVSAPQITLPVANFSASPQSGIAPLTVQFNDLSTGAGITAWAWDFSNDGIIESTQKNPVHTYNASGTYSVNLTVSGLNGSGTVLKRDLITSTIKQAPVTVEPTLTQMVTTNVVTPTYTTTTPGQALLTPIPTPSPAIQPDTTSSLQNTNPEISPVPSQASPGPGILPIAGALSVLVIASACIQKRRLK